MRFESITLFKLFKPFTTNTPLIALTCLRSDAKKNSILNFKKIINEKYS